MEHMLENTWTLFVTNQRTTQGHEKNVKEWEDRLKKVHTFETAEAFWSIQNNLRPAGEMINDSGDFYLFKEGILPEWEDKMNVGGGRWVIFSDVNRVENEWTLLMLSLIGNLYEELNGIICGAELAVRPKKRFKIAVWVKQADGDTILQLGEMIKRNTNGASLEFQKHGGDKIEFKV
jgi:translation initiation factor 4E